MSPAEPLSVPLPEPPAPPLLWDIFCHVIDNWGDLGVCWRLTRQLAQRGQRVRLWVDDASALAWMAPGALQYRGPQGQGQRGGHWMVEGELAGLRVYPWPRQQPDAPAPAIEPGDVLIEAFGCHIEPHWVQALQPEGRAGQVWLNLEYLSAEPWVERCHGLPSPVLSGPLAGRCKWFYYPGFSGGSGGLLRETAHCPTPAPPPAPSTPETFEPAVSDLQILLFCYEAPALAALLAEPALAQAHWLVAAGRTQATWQAVWSGQPPPKTTLLPLLAQTEFDALLRTCHLNLVRGEDSLVSALWAGQPLLWQLYPQQDGAQHAKLEAFLHWLAAPPCLRQWHRAWNGAPSEAALPPLTAQRLQAWRQCIQAARQRLLQQADLVSQLLGFVGEKR